MAPHPTGLNLRSGTLAALLLLGIAHRALISRDFVRSGILEVYLKAAVYAVLAAAVGAIVGSLFDSNGTHSHAQTLALLVAVAAAVWRISEG
jgi:hypothetical protein